MSSPTTPSPIVVRLIATSLISGRMARIMGSDLVSCKNVLFQTRVWKWTFVQQTRSDPSLRRAGIRPVAGRIFHEALLLCGIALDRVALHHLADGAFQRRRHLLPLLLFFFPGDGARRNHH